MSHDISIYVWYYEIDPKTGEKLYKPGEAKGILTIKIYLTIKYILIDNKYIEGDSTMLHPQTRINGIDRFFKSHILPDLPDWMTDYVTKVDQIYLATSWKKQGGPSLLPQSAEGVESLGALLPYF